MFGIIDIYCFACGGPFVSVDIRNPIDLDLSDNYWPPWLLYSDPYDERVLSKEQTEWLTDVRIIDSTYILLAKSLPSTRGLSMVEVSANQGLSLEGHNVGFYEFSVSQPVPSHDGSTPLLSILKTKDGYEPKFFPVHACCLALMERLCSSRKASLSQVSPSKPQPVELEEFYDALRCREKKIQQDYEARRQNNCYGRAGGLEWEHGYYGVRQSWGGLYNWENQEGGEWHCADPIKVPNMSPYIISQIPKRSKHTDDSSIISGRLEAIRIMPSTDSCAGLSTIPTEVLSSVCDDLPFLSVIALRKTCKILHARVDSLLTPRFWRTRVQAGEVLPWLLPDELDIEESGQSLDCHWEEGVKALTVMASDVRPHESKYEEVVLPGARQIGLENRWRIWKILRAIGKDGEEL